MATPDYDVVIIGSGFGGSVAALRAAEKGYRVGVMESGRRWRDEDIPKTEWDLPKFLWLPAAELYGIQRIEYLDDVLILCGAGRRRRLARLREHAVRPAEAVLRRAGVGGHHRLGRRAGAVHRPGHADARGRPLPLHADRHGPGAAAGRDRDRARGDLQQGARRRLLREPGRRGRGPLLRRRRTAAHRLHLVRQLRHRLRPQRQEQADDELPLPRGEARRRGPRTAGGARPRSARRRRVRGARAPSRLGAARRAPARIAPTPPSR